ncbi:MAG: H(+)/Cl(-) exchange transporter ClcA [Tatlockia sp.]|jgi:CIC family chloride channel protein
MRNKLVIVYGIAILLGVFTGAISSFFQIAIHALDGLIAKTLAFLSAKGFSAALCSALISTVFVFVAWLMVKDLAPEAAGSGVQEIEGALLHKRPLFWRRLLPVKFLAGVLAISAKLVLGREGPTIQMGGNLGEMLSSRLHLSTKRRDTLIMAGAGAGLAAAFNAPLAGVLFVMEELRLTFRFNFTNFTTVALCSVMATITLHYFIGDAPAIQMRVFDLPSLRSLWLFFLLGLWVGMVGLVFNKLLMKSLCLTDKLNKKQIRLYVILVGLLVGFFAYTYPALVGGGYEIINQALNLSSDIALLFFLFVIRFITTMLCYSTRVPGGIFAPMLALGALLGTASAYLFQVFFVDSTIHPGMFAVAGMGALFSATVRAPITGIVLVVEMTQNYLLILPLMVCCLTATMVMQFAGDEPIYTQLLRRTLKQGV